MGLNFPSYPKLSYLQTLVAVADAGSFSEAALRLQVSQSSVSYAIAALEDQLGVILLSRGRQGAHLTPVGEQIVSRARRITHLLEDVVKQANLAKGLEGGYVRIAAFRSAASHLLPEAIAEFCRRYPAISVRIAEYDDCPEAEEALRQGRADLAITYLPPGSDLETWELVKDDFVVLFPPDFEPTSREIDWSDLTTYPLVMAPEGDRCDELVYQHCAQYGVTLVPKYHVRSDATIVSMVAKGIGATISPRLATIPTPPSVHTYSLPVPLIRNIRIATLKESLLTPAGFALLDLLREMCAHPDGTNQL